MRRRLAPLALVLIGFAALGGATAAQGRYNYGGGSSIGYGEGGFVVEVEAGIANPRNTDNIVAAAGPNVIIPEWDDEFAGRLGLGYRFENGSNLMFRFWGFEAEQDAAGTGSFAFPVGPISGFGFDVTTEISANTVDVSWGVEHQPTEALELEWSLGLRYAGFEETTDGTYSTGSGMLGVDKSNEGTMLGVRAATRATYRRGSISGGVGLGISLLDGEIEAGSSLAPQPAGTTPLYLKDDSRSGTILDVDVRGAWHSSDDVWSIWVGWETQVWEDIAADLTRNLPDSEIISRERDSVTFSWAKLGVSYRF